MEQVWHCLAIKLQRELFKSSCFNLTAPKNVDDYCEKARAKLVKTGEGPMQAPELLFPKNYYFSCKGMLRDEIKSLSLRCRTKTGQFV